MTSSGPGRGTARVVVAPDKFHGTAGAAEVAAAAARGVADAGMVADPVPMADGGEGTLDALAVLGGQRRVGRVAGPMGAPVDAEWLLVDASGEAGAPAGLATGLRALGLDGDGPLAVIEAARVVGRSLHPDPTGDDPLRAETTGVGQLALMAAAAGARTIVIGLGGTAATDGGWGALSAIGPISRLGGARLVVASDVTTPFRDAAPVFGPQKGATPDQVRILEERLDRLAERYLRTWGVDVRSIPGAGAAGGLAGGLAAIGAVVVPGVRLVAASVGLAGRMASARAVVTGEGRLDATSFAGKVLAGVLEVAGGRVPLWCVVGEVDPGMDPALVPEALRGRVVSLVDAFGRRRAMDATTSCVTELVREVVVPQIAALAP